MAGRRSYDQYCGLAKALDIVGERWTLLVVRNLLLGPLRYSDLLRGLPGITTNLLAKRLQEMEASGLIEQVRSAASHAGHAYRLTTLGAGLEPAVHALGGWGWHRMKTAKAGDTKSLEYLLVALRRRYRGGATLRAELIADDVPYRLVLSDTKADIARGDVASPDVRVRGPGRAIMRLFVDPTARIPSEIDVEGRPEKLKILLRAFAPDDASPRI